MPLQLLGIGDRGSNSSTPFSTPAEPGASQRKARWVPSSRAAAWARERWSSPSIIDAAVELLHGRAATLDAAEVDRLLDHVERTLIDTE